MTYPIRDDIPLPKLRRDRTPHLQQALLNLQPLQCTTVTDLGHAHVCSIVNGIKKKTGRNFTTKNVKGVIHIWRIDKGE